MYLTHSPPLEIKEMMRKNTIYERERGQETKPIIILMRENWLCGALLSSLEWPAASSGTWRLVIVHVKWEETCLHIYMYIYLCEGEEIITWAPPHFFYFLARKGGGRGGKLHQFVIFVIKKIIWENKTKEGKGSEQQVSSNIAVE